MSDNHIDPEVKKALDERIDWIDAATDLVRANGPDALGPMIDELDDEHLRSMIYVLVLQRASDMENVAGYLAKLN